MSCNVNLHPTLSPALHPPPSHLPSTLSRALHPPPSHLPFILSPALHPPPSHLPSTLSPALHPLTCPPPSHLPSTLLPALLPLTCPPPSHLPSTLSPALHPLTCPPPSHLPSPLSPALHPLICPPPSHLPSTLSPALPPLTCPPLSHLPSPLSSALCPPPVIRSSYDSCHMPASAVTPSHCCTLRSADCLCAIKVCRATCLTLTAACHHARSAPPLPVTVPDLQQGAIQLPLRPAALRAGFAAHTLQPILPLSVLISHSLDLAYNYLTGTVPVTVGAALKSLYIGGNFRSGSIGTLTGVTCSAALKCLTSQGSCTTGGVLNRAGCNICGSANTQRTLFSNGLCVPNATAAVASSETPTLSTPMMPMYCTGVTINAAAGDALLPCMTAMCHATTMHAAAHQPSSIVSHTAASPLVTLSALRPLTYPFRSLSSAPSPHPYLSRCVPVTVLGNIKTAAFTALLKPTAVLKPKATAPVPSSWSGVLCNSLGQPVNLSAPSLPHPLLLSLLPVASSAWMGASSVSLKLENQKLTSSLHADISKLFTLTTLDVSFNFFRANIDTWASPLKLATNLLSLRLNNNYLFGSVPLWLVSFAKLTNFKLSMNELTGTFSAPISTALKCLMPSYGCQFCGTTNALGTACMGNPCVPVTPTPITAINKWNPVPVMRCDPVPVQAPKVTLPRQPSAAVAPPLLGSSAGGGDAGGDGTGAVQTCTIAGQAYIPGTLPLAFCKPAGMVLDMYVPLLAPLLPPPPPPLT
ncbi:unnamed protein product [Closterium sp. NIES-64]|nr:unnamed protein product [Closterium sp. NIES-64]